MVTMVDGRMKGGSWGLVALWCGLYDNCSRFQDGVIIYLILYHKENQVNMGLVL